MKENQPGQFRQIRQEFTAQPAATGSTTSKEPIRAPNQDGPRQRAARPAVATINRPQSPERRRQLPSPGFAVLTAVRALGLNSTSQKRSAASETIVPNDPAELTFGHSRDPSGCRVISLPAHRGKGAGMEAHAATPAFSCRNLSCWASAGCPPAISGIPAAVRRAAVRSGAPSTARPLEIPQAPARRAR